MSAEKISKLSLVYTPCYCEENVWKLCEEVRLHLEDILDDCFAIFISNQERLIPLWSQRNSVQQDGFIIWDYHVIFVHKKGHNTLIYDFDTTLGFPCEYMRYATMGIKCQSNMDSKYHRYFRVIKAMEYLDNFASDRSHMRNENGTWKAAPPEYVPIAASQSTNNLDDFISMDSDKPYGTVMSLNDFIAFLQQ